MILVADIEADGLYETVSKIHCIVTKDKESGNVSKFFDEELVEDGKPIVSDGTISDGIDYLAKADCVVGHNWIDYDARVIRKFFPNFEIDVKKIRDTYIRSLLADPHRQRHFNCPPSKPTIAGRKMIGPHGLENWGYIVGLGKVEHEDWTRLTPAMLKRCIVDVGITDAVDDVLEKEMAGWDWSTAEWIEKQFRFILSEQESYGWLFDLDAARKATTSLTGLIDRIEAELRPRLPCRVAKSTRVCTQIHTKNGGYHRNFIRWFEAGSNESSPDMQMFRGDFCKVSFEPINLNSEKQVKEYLLSVGWAPTDWNYKREGKRIVKDSEGKPIKTSPKLTEDSFESLTDNTGQLIVKRILYSHRRSQIQGWIDAVRPNGRIGAGGNSVGTNTGRVTHRLVVNVPKAEDEVFYGKEMRALFMVPEGKTQVGIDLRALEDRVAGHYTFKYDGGEYARMLLEGDPHQRTANFFSASRSKGKICNHALKYGAQPPKLCQILSIDEKTAIRYWNLWWKKHPSLHALKAGIEKSLRKRKQLDKRGKLNPYAYVKGIDGRKIFVRSKHSLVNAVIQNAGSVVNKLTTIFIYEEVQDNWVDANFVGNFHDETQSEVLDKHVPIYSRIAERAVERVNDFFKFNIPMEVEIKTGRNWCETH